MTEKPREYKRRVDAEWRKNEKNKNKLIKKIKEYELLNEEKKEGIEKEILEAFSKNEKKGKGKEYEEIVKLIEDADRKYEVLDQLREQLRAKEEEKEQKEVEIRENKLDRTDKTVMDIQMAGRTKLVEEREILGKEIEEIKKEISDREEEIKDIEDEYGNNSDIEGIGNDESIEDKKVTSKKTEIKEPATLEEYHEQTIRDLWEKDRVRGEIMKILEEGSWIGDELSEKIRKEVSDAFFTYYDEKQGSLRMKAGRRGKNKLNKRGNCEKEQGGQENENTEEVVVTPRKNRENLILRWYQKKLNRDELLRILEEEIIMDKKSKKKLKEEIIKDFYENYEKAKGEKDWSQMDGLCKDVKRTKRQLGSKARKLTAKRKEREGEMKMIDEEMESIAQNAMKLEKSSWLWDKRKLEKSKKRRDELDKQERKIKNEIGKLEMEKLELQLSLKDKEDKYGPKIQWWLRRPEKVGRKISKEQEESELEEQTTLKGYKERYEQMIKDREEYYEKLLGIVRDLDIGISEEKKREVLENIELNIKKEVEKLEEGNEFTKMADEIKKWLEDNWKVTMENLIGKKKEIEEKDNQIKELEAKEKGENITTDEVIQIRKKEYKLTTDLFELKEEYDQTKTDLEEKLGKYDGTYISEKNFVVETFEERMWKIENKIEETKKMLETHREAWKREINLTSETKEKIIKAAEKVPVRVEENEDGSELITIWLSGKVYRILVVQNIYSYSDDEYINSEGKLNEKGMVGDDMDGWKNQRLKEYVKEKSTVGLHIPTQEEMKELLKDLGEQAGLHELGQEIAMLMYLTGMCGEYFIGMSSSSESRCVIDCDYALIYGLCYYSRMYARAPLLLYSES